MKGSEDFLCPFTNFALIFLSLLGAKPLEARGEAASTLFTVIRFFLQFLIL